MFVCVCVCLLVFRFAIISQNGRKLHFHAALTYVCIIMSEQKLKHKIEKEYETKFLSNITFLVAFAEF